MTETAQTARARYGRHKEAAGQRQRDESRSGRDIGPIPPVANPERRARCRLNLQAFADEYFPERFYLAWSPDQRRAMERLQTCVLEGGQHAQAAPRGDGKTSRVEVAVIWSVCYGHRQFPFLIGATLTHGQEILASIVTEIEVNERLGEDFPEVCFPIRELEGAPQRCPGQLCEGERTLISWTADEVVLPTVAGSVASGAIIRVAGITGRIRGQKFTRQDGRSVRPDLVLIDDPQTEESAHSLSQCARREKTLAGAVLGLAGPGKKIAALMPCTVIRAGDVADNILDRDKHPEWSGERMKLVYAFPTNEKLWEQYGEIRAQSLRTREDISEATTFYVEHRAEMDEGAIVAWPERFNPDEVSAIQHAMNLKLADEAAFMAEMQNEPISGAASVSEDVALLGADEIARRLSEVPEGIVPSQATRLTGMIDVQQRLLYWLVCAWRDDFTGWVVSYGTFPKQDRERFTYGEAPRTLAHEFPGAGVEGQLAAGLRQLTDELCAREWPREPKDSGATMRLDKLLVDANWTLRTEIVYTACRRSSFATQLLASHGHFFGVQARPLAEQPRQPGDRGGYGWRMPAGAPTPLVRFDAGMWKSFVHARLATAPGDPGSLTLFGKAPARHRMLAEHLTSETRERLQGNARVVDVWTETPHRDNHLFDCLVGCAVAASIGGAATAGMEPARQPRERRRIRFADVHGGQVG